MVEVRLGSRYARTALALLFLVAVGAAGPGTGEVTDSLRQKALALNDVTGAQAIKGKVKALADDPAGTRRLLATAVRMTKEKEQPFNYNAAYILANVAIDLEDYESSEAFFRLCASQAEQLKSGTKLVESYYGLITLLNASKKYAESEKLCRRFLEMEDEEGQLRKLKAFAMQELIRSIAKQKRTDEALKLVDNLTKIRGDDFFIVGLKAEVLHDAERFQDEAKAYEQALDLIAKDKALEKEEREYYTEKYRYFLAGVFVELKQVDKATAQFKALLAAKPDNATYNNDLGYVWADHDQNLDEAEKLIRKAIEEERKKRKARKNLKPEEDKDNAAFLDSLGWVLYKKKKYQDAKPVLLEAVRDKGGQHAEIFDHLGDVHMALGEKAEAVAAWKKALESSGTAKRDLERKAQVEKKLKQHQQAAKP